MTVVDWVAFEVVVSVWLSVPWPVPVFGLSVMVCIEKMSASSPTLYRCVWLHYLDCLEHASVIVGLASTGKFFICGSFAVVYVAAAELYPTPVRYPCTILRVSFWDAVVRDEVGVVLFRIYHFTDPHSCSYSANFLDNDFLVKIV